jgi:hypothetical protein
LPLPIYVRILNLIDRKQFGNSRGVWQGLIWRYTPRAPLPITGVTVHGVKSCFTSESISPSFIAHIGSCARPRSSGCLPFVSTTQSLQVVASPCCIMVLPDAISAEPSSGVWTPTPAASKLLVPISSLRALAFPQCGQGQRFAPNRRMTSRREHFRSCSHFFMFRPQCLLATLVIPTLSIPEEQL